MDILHYIGEWITAVFEHWEGYVSGGVIGFSLELWKRFRDWEPSKKVFGALVILGLLFSIFSAWKDERVKYEQEAKKEEPLLIVTVFDMVRGQVIGDPKFHSSMLLRMEIKDSGAPSVAGNWTLVIDAQPQADCERMRIPETLELPRNDNGPPYVFHASEALYEKVETEPIPRGGARRGIIFFHCALSPELLLRASGKLRVQDVNGTWWEGEFIHGSLQEHQPYYPGISH